MVWVSSAGTVPPSESDRWSDVVKEPPAGDLRPTRRVALIAIGACILCRRSSSGGPVALCRWVDQALRTFYVRHRPVLSEALPTDIRPRSRRREVAPETCELGEVELGHGDLELRPHPTEGLECL